MKLVIITAGTLGDTAPYIGLGARLKAAGHDVAIAAQRAFDAQISEAGLEFRQMPGDVRALLASENGQRLHRARSWLEALPAAVRLAQELFSELADGIVEAARGAELLLLHRLVLMHGHLVADAMNIPFLTLELFPSGLVPTAEFLPAGLGAASLGRSGNRFVYALLRRLAGRSPQHTAFLYDFQRKFGLPRVAPGDLYRRMERERRPIYHAFSSLVVPRPKDWPEPAQVVGYLWPPSPASFRAPDRLTDFLSSGSPPVFIGFGSLVPPEAERLTQLLTRACRLARVRAVIQTGWGAAPAPARSDDVLAIGSVPHEWLFPRMAAVVHAAGAGVTAAGLRAGVPAVPVPAMNDQAFWADRLLRLGVSPGALRFQRLSARALAALIHQAVSEPAHRRRAREVSRALQREDGAGRIVEAVAETAMTAAWP